MPEQQPDAVTELADIIDAAFGTSYTESLVAARAVLAWVEERCVPRAEYEELEVELEGSVWRQGKMEEVIEAVRADREALRQAVLNLAQHFETRDHLPRWYAGQQLRALVERAS